MSTEKKEPTEVSTVSNESVPDPTEAPATSRPVVELRGISKTYPGGTHAAVAEMNLAIQEGEFFSILGSSGSGKTTTLRMIAGFEQPTSGQVLLDGYDATGIPPFRRDVNTVFQNYALFPHMKVEANVGYPLKMAGVSKKEIAPRVAEALERVSMTGYEKRLPHQLSGGQRQRVALARALIRRPRLLLLDEPLGALDLKLRENMLLVLKNLQREVGITFIYVTHDQGEALAMSDRLAVMNEGRVEQIASPTEVYDQPATSFVAGFIGKTNLLECQHEAGTRARTGAVTVALDREPEEASFVLSIRPEAIVVGEESRGLANHFEARVGDVLFLGHEREVLADLGEQRLMLRSSSNNLTPGGPIEFGWRPEDAVIVKPTGTWQDLQEEPEQ
ncbi:MAG: ABC transporter ATP-binding protein [Solirubrobacterales bacterium]